MSFLRSHYVLCLLSLMAVGLPRAVSAELSPDWVARLPAGTSLSAGPQGMIVDSSGVSFVTGISGPSSNTDISTAAFAADGSLLWSQVFNGPEDWHDQGRGLGFGAEARVHVVGNTPGPNLFSQVLVLTYDGATGALLDTIQYSGGPFLSEHGEEVVTDAAGNIYVGGGTVGDGGDVLILKFDSAGNFLWKQVWDGPAQAPFSQDTIKEIQIDPDGDLVVLIHGVMNSLHPDYVVVKYATTDGAKIWESTWGVSGGDFPRDMEIDEAGDIYVTGIGLDFTDKLSTLKMRGSDGALLWQEYDGVGIDDAARALVLDGEGGVVITGSVDFDGDVSNFNDKIYTVRRDAMTGGLLWTHVYGDTCVGCLDAPTDVEVDPAGHVFVAGATSSPPYSGDVILLVLDLASGLETDRGVVSAQGSQQAGSGVLAFDATYNLYDGGQTTNYDTGEVEMTVTRWASMAQGDSIPCDDLRRLQSQCVSRPAQGSRLRIRLLLTDSSHDGESVMIATDGAPYSMTIGGDRAQISISGVQAGEHTVELIDPGACLAPVVVNCPVQ